MIGFGKWELAHIERNAQKAKGYVALQFYCGDNSLINISDVYDTHEQALASVAEMQVTWDECEENVFNPCGCYYTIAKVKR